MTDAHNAMRLALESLKLARHGHCDHATADQSIEALRAALAQAPDALRDAKVLAALKKAAVMLSIVCVDAPHLEPHEAYGDVCSAIAAMQADAAKGETP